MAFHLLTVSSFGSPTRVHSNSTSFNSITISVAKTYFAAKFDSVATTDSMSVELYSLLPESNLNYSWDLNVAFQCLIELANAATAEAIFYLSC